jgi:LPXTG-motif cell wall-anchored protein
MGLPSAGTSSGKLAIGSGIICLIGAGAFYSKRIRKDTTLAVQKVPEQLIEQ